MMNLTQNVLKYFGLDSSRICLVKRLHHHYVKSVQIRTYSGPHSVPMRENTARLTPNTDTFHAVYDFVV